MENYNITIKEVFDAQNLLRTNPKYYIPYLEDMVSNFKGKNLVRPGYAELITQEGPAAVKEAIKFLSKQKPLKELTLSKTLSKAAQEHADDLGENNMTGHTGSQGSTMQGRIEKYGNWSGSIGENCSFSWLWEGGHEFVIGLVIDDGIPGRGHRENIFNPDFKYVGIGISSHPTYELGWILDYAGGISEKASGSKKESSRTPSGKAKMHEESKSPKEGSTIKLSDCPQEIIDQINKLGIADTAAVVFENGTYNITYTKPCPSKSSSKPAVKPSPKTTDSKSVSKSSKGSHKEPSGYVSKNIETQTRTCGTKVTKTVKTTYTFRDGSTQTFTETTKNY